MINCQYKLLCPHAGPGNEACATAGCIGVDYSTAVVKDVLLNGIADADIKRDILGDATLGSETVQEVVTIVEAKEAARDAVATSCTAQTAASSTYKNNARAKTLNAPAASTPPASGPPHRLREKRCRCGNAYFDYAERANGGWNSRSYKECRDCCLSKRKSEKRNKKGGRKMNAAAQTFDSDSSFRSLPPARIFSASLHTNATLCGQRSPAGDHPCLDIKFTFPMASDFIEMKTEGAVADSGAQLHLPGRLLTRRKSLPLQHETNQC